MTLRMLSVAVSNFCGLFALYGLGSSQSLARLTPYMVAGFASTLEVACLFGAAYWVRCSSQRRGSQMLSLFSVELVAFLFFTAQCLLGVRILAAYFGDTP